MLPQSAQFHGSRRLAVAARLGSREQEERESDDDGADAAARAGDLAAQRARLATLAAPITGDLGANGFLQSQRRIPDSLGMTLAHMNSAEARGEVSPRVALLMAIRDKLALALREEP